MGMRSLQLNTSYTGDASAGTAVLHVSQMPPNAALFPPGPALLYARFLTFIEVELIADQRVYRFINSDLSS